MKLALGAAVVALLSPVPAIGLLASSPRDAPGTGAGPHTDVILDASALPASTGWFRYNLRAASATNVTFELRLRLVDVHEGAVVMPIIARPDEPAPLFFGSGWSSPPMLEVNHGRTLFACCPSPDTQALGLTSYAGRMRMNGTLDLAPGQALQVGLAVIDWSPNNMFRFTAHVNRGHVHLEGPATGFAVERVDLVDAAYAAGDNLRVGGGLTVGTSSAYERRWVARETGLLALSYYMAGDGRGNFAATLPDGDVYDTGRGHDISGSVIAATAPGDIVVRADGVQEANSLTPFATNRWSWVSAQAVFADVPLETRGVRAYQELHDDDGRADGPASLR